MKIDRAKSIAAIKNIKNPVKKIRGWNALRKSKVEIWERKIIKYTTERTRKNKTMPNNAKISALFLNFIELDGL